jgi:hypothetical protein
LGDLTPYLTYVVIFMAFKKNFASWRGHNVVTHCLYYWFRTHFTYYSYYYDTVISITLATHTAISHIFIKISKGRVLVVLLFHKLKNLVFSLKALFAVVKNLKSEAQNIIKK